jgi:hypothetical protein
MTTIRILLRDFSDFENALAAEIAAFHEWQNEIQVETDVVTIHELYDGIFHQGGFRDGR